MLDLEQVRPLFLVDDNWGILFRLFYLLLRQVQAFQDQLLLVTGVSDLLQQNLVSLHVEFSVFVKLFLYF